MLKDILFFSLFVKNDTFSSFVVNVSSEHLSHTESGTGFKFENDVKKKE